MIIIEWGNPIELSERIRQYDTATRAILFDIVGLWQTALYRKYYHLGTRDRFGRPILVIEKIRDCEFSEFNVHLKTLVYFNRKGEERVSNTYLDLRCIDGTVVYTIVTRLNNTEERDVWIDGIRKLGRKSSIYCTTNTEVTLKFGQYERNKLEATLNRLYRYVHNLEEDKRNYLKIVEECLGNNKIED